jgi:hypothetical protein
MCCTFVVLGDASYIFYVLCLVNAEKQQNNMQCPDGAKITNAITEFVMQEEGGDVETLRKALYCQVKTVHYILLVMC